LFLLRSLSPLDIRPVNFLRPPKSWLDTVSAALHRRRFSYSPLACQPQVTPQGFLPLLRFVPNRLLAAFFLSLSGPATGLSPCLAGLRSSAPEGSAQPSTRMNAFPSIFFHGSLSFSFAFVRILCKIYASTPPHPPPEKKLTPPKR